MYKNHDQKASPLNAQFTSNSVVNKSTYSFDDKRFTRRNLVSLLIASELENPDITSHSQNHVIFSRLLFLDGSFQQAETYSIYRVCKNLTIYRVSFTSLPLQWNSVIPHLWKILYCTCMVINTYMTPVMKKKNFNKICGFQKLFFRKISKHHIWPWICLGHNLNMPSHHFRYFFYDATWLYSSLKDKE